jgi:uncharacterized protein YodC (DUF2158 family)
MASGKPTVVVKDGGYPETIIDGSNGMVGCRGNRHNKCSKSDIQKPGKIQKSM